MCLNGSIVIMDMNFYLEVYVIMVFYIFILLKSIEFYLDEYFFLDIEKELVNVGFVVFKIICNIYCYCIIIVGIV